MDTFWFGKYLAQPTTLNIVPYKADGEYFFLSIE